MIRSYILILAIIFLGCKESNTSKIEGENLSKKDSKRETVIKNTKSYDVKSWNLSDFYETLNRSTGKKELNIAAIQLDTLPPEFYLESQAEYIWIDCIGIGCVDGLYPEIKNFTKLRELHLIKTSLIELPEEIGMLQSLKVLQISAGGILRSLPESIGNLKNLEELNLWRNGLKELPRSLEKLENLRKLELGQNKFSKKEKELIRQRFPKGVVTFKE